MDQDERSNAPQAPLTRRVLLGAVVSSGLARGAESDEAASQRDDSEGGARVVRLFSPKDAFVLKISQTDGARVTAGLDLCTLDSEEETRALQRLDETAALLNIESKALTPEGIAMQRRVLEIAVNLTSTYVEFAKRKLEYDRDEVNIQLRVAVGQLSHQEWIVPEQDAAAVVKATSEKEKAELALKNFDFNIVQAQLRQKVLYSHIEEERKFIQREIARLSIKSPVPGTVKYSTSPGTFVQKGQLIAEVAQ